MPVAKPSRQVSNDGQASWPFPTVSPRAGLANVCAAGRQCSCQIGRDIWIGIAYSTCGNARCELERVPSAFAGLLPHCTLSGLFPERKGEFQSDQPENRQNRLKQQNVDSETGEVVSRDDMVRGYEVAKGQYMIVEDQEIEAVQIESTRTIDIDQFVPKNEIDERYIDSPYYIAPDGPVGQEAFAVIRDTIAKLNMVALGRVVLARREHVIALEPKGRGLVGTTFRYPYEVRDDEPYFEDIPELKLSKEMLDLAAHIVQTKSGHFDPSQFEDRYENALIDLLKKKQAGEKIEPAREAPPPRVVNLMEALRASVDAEKKKAPASSTRARRPAKKKATR